LFQIELAPRGEIQAVFCVSHDGKSLAAANDSDKTIRVWSLADGKETVAFRAARANQGFGGLDYSADGKRLVSSHHDRTYRFWDSATAAEIRRMSVPLPAPPTGNFTPMGRVNFTPDGKALAVAEDWAVRFLDAEDGKELRWFGGHVAPVASYAFSPDGKRMVTVAGDRSARLWDAGHRQDGGPRPPARRRRARGVVLRRRQGAGRRLQRPQRPRLRRGHCQGSPPNRPGRAARLPADRARAGRQDGLLQR
jgi:hypothetical protein